jgi:hypothetical protein
MDQRMCLLEEVVLRGRVVWWILAVIRVRDFLVGEVEVLKVNVVELLQTLLRILGA